MLLNSLTGAPAAWRRIPHARRAAARPARSVMFERHPERLPSANRLRTMRDFGALKESGVSFRGPLCVLVTAASADGVTRVGFIASKKTVGNAPRRNRARRRMREIVRRRWPRVPADGRLVLLIATRRTVEAPHQELASEIERLMDQAGVLRPIPAEVL